MKFSVCQSEKNLCKVTALYSCSVSVSGDSKGFIEKHFISNGIECSDSAVIKVSAIFDDSRQMTYVEESRNLTDEKYIINTVESDGYVNIVITYSGKRALYYAVCDIARRIKNKVLEAGETVDYPLFATRGYIEGFYGTPWNFLQRVEMLKLMTAHRMNTYFYAPKDDIYHRERWSELYPEKELCGLRTLVEAAEEYFADFWFCIAPGLDMCYSDEEQFEKLVCKCKQLYGIGVRKFGLLLDDIPEQLTFDADKQRFSEAVNAHAFVTNKLYDALKAIDGKIEMAMCPLQYHGRGDEYYISRIGRSIEPSIKIFWTGHNICSQELTAPEAARFIEHTYHKPLYWDNFPVNDAEMFNEMHIGYIMGRDPELYRYSSGLISNCMEFFECSKIPLLTVADYLWNPVCYDCDKSWKYALKTVVGEDWEAFSYFAEHLTVSCLKSDVSPMMVGAVVSARTHIMTGNLLQAAVTLGEYVDKVEECCELIKKHKGEKLYTELERWSDKFLIFGEIMSLCRELITSDDTSVKDTIEEKLYQFIRLPETMTDFCFRETVEYLLSLTKEVQ
ncbi:MAG: beta-N-acetylglucosaminidase domain-containing protein [Clostridia bacterium]|nr:beta-N-acetylglucosaminidase domain-containing protein [Clostridia bacterium]